MAYVMAAMLSTMLQINGSGINFKRQHPKMTKQRTIYIDTCCVPCASAAAMMCTGDVRHLLKPGAAVRLRGCRGMGMTLCPSSAGGRRNPTRH